MEPTTCPTCDRKVNGTVLCARCAVSSDKRAMVGLMVPGDYPLHELRGDVLMCGLAFLHACGVVEAFMEKVDSVSIPELMSTHHYVRIRPENLIRERIRREYNRRGRVPRVKW